jgi:anti-anti-sigma factor
MLRATVQEFGDTAIVKCQGQIVVGERLAILREAARAHATASILVLDLAGVERIDAGGLGLLLSLRQWAYANAIRFKLMNVMKNVDRVIRLTKLDCVFEFWSLSDMLYLVYLARLPGASEVRDFRACRSAA